jgi:transmembrane sensor
MTDVERIEDEASLWVVREDRGLSLAERDALDRWLGMSTAHRVAYLQMQQAWSRADRLAALRGPAPMREARRNAGAVLPRLAAIAAVLAICLGGAGWYYYAARAAGQTYATGIGQHQAVQLADGTRIELNTDSRLQAQVTGSARTIRLEKGEAYFDVTHDANRPFMVLAGNRRITDIGTKFSVRVDGDQVRVLVREGEVKVETLDGRAVQPAMANAGHAVVTQGNGLLVANRAPHEVARELSWRSGILVFDQETLTAAAAEFNRYNVKKVVVLGQARNLHVGGRFRANNADVFASLIQAGMGVNVRDTGDEIIISK